MNLAGLAFVAKQSVTGLGIAGLAVVTEGEMTGAGLSGLALVGNAGITGFSFAGAAIVSKGDITGAQFTVGELRSESSVTGVSVAGFRTKAVQLTGLHLNIVMTQAEYTEGVISGIYNRVSAKQTGLSIGIFNHATVLRGVQIGIINYAESNPPLLKILPLLNADF